MSISTISKPYTFTNDTTAEATEVNSDFDTLYTAVNTVIGEINDGMGGISGLDERLDAIEAVAGDATTLLDSLLTVDGASSGLDADLLDGAHASVTPTADTIPIAGADNKLDVGWIPATVDADKVDGFEAEALRKYVVVQSATASDIATAIPVDDTIPQVSEGTEIASAAITPSSVSNRILVEFYIPYDTTTTYMGVAAVFCTAIHSTNAIGAVACSTNSGAAPNMIVGRFFITPASTAEHKFKLRVGPGDSGTLSINKGGSARIFGGTNFFTFSVREVSV